MKLSDQSFFEIKERNGSDKLLLTLIRFYDQASNLKTELSELEADIQKEGCRCTSAGDSIFGQFRTNTVNYVFSRDILPNVEGILMEKYGLICIRDLV